MVIGVLAGIVAVVNILFRHLTHQQISWLLIFGLVNWGLGGLICYATEAIRIEEPPPQRKSPPKILILPDHEWHSASEFRLPGSGRLLLRFPYKHTSRETFDHYRVLRSHRQNHHA